MCSFKNTANFKIKISALARFSSCFNNLVKRALYLQALAKLPLTLTTARVLLQTLAFVSETLRYRQYLICTTNQPFILTFFH